MEEQVLADEHRVPTQLGERVPLMPFLFPFDWTQRQVYWMALWFWMGSLQGGWDTMLVYLAIGLAGVVVEYAMRPSPEFWLSAYLEYFSILLVSFPMWWKRLLPGGYAGVDWPLAALPLWLGRRVVARVEVLNDGVLRLPGRLGQPARFAVAIGLQPRPHPDMLPMLNRQAIIDTRLSIFKLIHGDWALHQQVRPFDPDQLRRASGPAWEWVRESMLPRMIVRRCALVLYGKRSEDLTVEAGAVLTRLHDVQMNAWRHEAPELRRLLSEMWSDTGILGSRRVRIGTRRVVTGLRTYRSWILTTLPHIIHLTWLRPVTSEALLCDTAIHVSRRPPAATRRSLQRRRRRWRAVDRDNDYEQAVADADRVLAAMRRNADTEITMGMYVTARIEQEQKVAEALATAQCEFEPADVVQHRALRTTRMLGGDHVNRKMHADLRTVATTDILATAGYWPTGGTLLGEGLSAPEPIALNPFDEANMNWATVIACMQGAGKTTTAQVLAWRMANAQEDHPLNDLDLHVVSIDFKASGDYANLYDQLSKRGHKASYNEWTGGHLPPIDGHVGFNLSDVPEEEQGDRLVELAQQLESWSRLHYHEAQILLIIDEILAILEARGGSSFLRRFGTQGRSLRIAPVFCTQDVETAMANRKAALALKNCATVFLGRQNPAGINSMTPYLSLDPHAQMLLATAPKGAGLLRVERVDGPVVLGLQVRPTPWELAEFGTNPSERVARWQRNNPVAVSSLTTNGKEHTNGYELGNGHVAAPVGIGSSGAADSRGPVHALNGVGQDG